MEKTEKLEVYRNDHVDHTKLTSQSIHYNRRLTDEQLRTSTANVSNEVNKCVL